MNRTRDFLAAALLCVLGAATAEAAAQDADALIRFRKAFFEGAAPVADRVAAARGIGLAEGRPAAEMACRALGETLDRMESLAKERSAVREELARIAAGREGDGSPDGGPEARKRQRELREREETLRLLDEGERGVAEELRRALLGFRDDRALEHLAATLRGALPGGVRAAAAEALGASRWEGAAKALRGALRDRDPQVREAALAALGRAAAKEEETRRSLAEALDDERWTVRIAAARRLAAMATPEAVDLLVARLAKEDGRLRRDLADLLRALTGQGFGIEPEGWTHWWKENRADFASGERPLSAPEPGAPPPSDGPAAGERASYYGIPIHSRRILYVVDVSGSMNDPGGGDPGVPRVDEAKKELLRSIRGLDAGSAFTIYAFNDAVRKWRPSLVKATAEGKEEARKWVDLLEAGAWTNTHAALEEALRASAADPRNNMGEDYAMVADTVFLLTDGAPTTPAGRLEDVRGRPEWQRVLEAVRGWNREKRVAVHCVGVGSAINAEFLNALARENGGRFVRVK